MNCPNCDFYNQTGANFCQNCGYRFDNIPQVEPIRVVVPQDNKPEPPTVVAQQPPPVIIQQKSAVPTGLIVFLTVLVTLVVVGGLGLLGFYLYTRSQNRNTVAVNVNFNATNANTAKPSPTPTPDYEQRRDEIAPPDKRTTLLDEQFEVEESSHRSIPFSVVELDGARIAGGFRVIKGKTVNFAVYSAEGYSDYPDGNPEPISSTQARNKVVNDRLKPGDYYLVFENNSDQPLTVAAELFIVND